MQPRRRVELTFEHTPADRVPIDYMANPAIDKKLKDYFNLAPDDNEGLRQKLNVDFRAVKVQYVGPDLHDPLPDRRIDMWGIRTRWVEHQSGGYWDYCDFPLEDADLDEVKAWPMPDPDDFDYDAAAKEAEAGSDFAVVAGDPGFADIINMTGMIRTMEQALIDLATNDDAGLYLIDRRIEIQLEVLRRFFERASHHLSILWIGEDLGTQLGPMVGPELYRTHLKPRHKRFVDLAHSFGLNVMFHSCGSSSWVFEDLIDMGVSIVDTLQPEAKNMAPSYLKERFGDRLSFHGCISTAGAVTYGTPDEVRRDVRETLEAMKPNGGYALAPTHWLQDNSPVENVVAMYEAAAEFGGY